MFEGAIIKETLKDELFLDNLQIIKTEIWKTNDPDIKYWTMVFLNSLDINLPDKLSKVIIENWFADMKQDNIKYIVFSNFVYQYTIGNKTEKEAVLEEMRKRGIPEEQFNWSE